MGGLAAPERYLPSVAGAPDLTRTNRPIDVIPPTSPPVAILRGPHEPTRPPHVNAGRGRPGAHPAGSANAVAARIPRSDVAGPGCALDPRAGDDTAGRAGGAPPVARHSRRARAVARSPGGAGPRRRRRRGVERAHPRDDRAAEAGGARPRTGAAVAVRARARGSVADGAIAGGRRSRGRRRLPRPGAAVRRAVVADLRRSQARAQGAAHRRRLARSAGAAARPARPVAGAVAVAPGRRGGAETDRAVARAHRRPARAPGHRQPDSCTSTAQGGGHIRPARCCPARRCHRSPSPARQPLDLPAARLGPPAQPPRAGLVGTDRPHGGLDRWAHLWSATTRRGATFAASWPAARRAPGMRWFDGLAAPHAGAAGGRFPRPRSRRRARADRSPERSQPCALVPDRARHPGPAARPAERSPGAAGLRRALVSHAAPERRAPVAPVRSPFSRVRGPTFAAAGTDAAERCGRGSA